MASNTPSIQKIISIFKDLAIRSEMVNDFGYGPSYNIGASRQMKFPYIWVENRDSQTIRSLNGYKESLYSFSIYCLDKINQGDNNYDQIISDTHYILDTMIQEMAQHKFYVDLNISLDGDIVMTPVVEATDDNSNGWMADITLKVPIRYTYCNSPIEPITGYETILTNGIAEYRLIGAQGPQGPTGAIGATGATGAQGQNGAQGATGAQGQNGAQGATGPQGQNGAQGATGPIKSWGEILLIGNTASVNVDINQFGLQNVGYIDFDTTPSGTNQPGRLIWNSSYDTIELGVNSNFNQLLGQQEVVKVVNKSNTNLLAA